MHNKYEILAYLKEIKSQLSHDGIDTIGLFGSYAKGTQNSSSDIDIVYKSGNVFIDKFQGWSAFTYLNKNLRDKISQRFDVEVDLFDLNSDSSIKSKVEKEAIYV